MLWTNTKRVIKSGFTNFWRNGFISLSSILVMIVTLFVIGSIIFVGATLKSSLAQLKSKVDINVYFITEAKEAEILEIKSALEKLPEVAKVEYISREQVLADFRERHSENELTLQAIDEVGENPFGATLNIAAKNPSQYESIATYLEGRDTIGNNGVKLIDKINYFQNKAAIDKLSRIISASDKLGFGLTILLVALSIIITFNTIRLTIYVSREEISVMRLVGAHNMYIRGPFVVAGMLYGAIAGIITLLIFYPVTLGLRGLTENFFAGINLFDYYIVNFGQIFLLIIGSGIVIGGISSYLAVRRYLKI